MDSDDASLSSSSLNGIATHVANRFKGPDKSYSYSAVSIAHRGVGGEPPSRALVARPFVCCIPDSQFFSISCLLDQERY